MFSFTYTSDKKCVLEVIYLIIFNNVCDIMYKDIYGFFGKEVLI